MRGSSVCLSLALALALARASVAIARGDSSKDTKADAKVDLERATSFEKARDFDSAISAAKKAVEEDPELIDAQEAFIRSTRMAAYAHEKDYDKARTESLERLTAQYGLWLKQFPNSAGVEYGFGSVYSGSEDPRAKPYLLKAVALNPKLAKAYEELCWDAERWGNERAAKDYMGKAAADEPNNPDYAFYYSYFFEETDPAKYVSLSLDVAKRFPESERGAQSLYWLGEHATSDEDKTRFWERDRVQFPPIKFSWSASAMSGLFDVYARTSPDKALTLAGEMKAISKDKRETDEWDSNAALAENLIAVQKLFAANQFGEAKALLERSKMSKYSNDLGMFELMKAQATSGAGDTKSAYDALGAYFAKTPEDAIHAGMLKYGADLGKTPAQVDGDVWAIRDSAAKPAPDFDLDTYLTKGKKSLADYRGKVVLLTFWFPGCGPCRGEFPHFENVIRKFRGQDVAYVGINVLPEQDDYVRPFMRGTRYSFTPLRSADTEKAYHVRGEPTNFLIDKTGRIVYENFRASDPKTERVLAAMIQSLLDRGTQAR